VSPFLRPPPAAALALAVLAGCRSAHAPDPKGAPSAAPSAGPVAASSHAAAAPVASASTSAAPAPSPGAELPFIANDWPRALADARRTHRPIFVDAWAPWCHTCLSLRAYVLRDPALAPFTSRFVWLAIDTERPENAAFLDAFPMHVWPTLWVVDPATGKPVLEWPGSASATELASLLEDAERAVVHGGHDGAAGAALVRGDQAAASGDAAKAIASYRDAIAAAPPDWPRRPRAVDALATQLAKAKQDEACALLARDETPRMPPSSARGSPPGTAARGLEGELLERIRRVAYDRTLSLVADDRSGLFEELVDSRKAAGDAKGTDEAARAWAAFLEDEAAKAPTPAARVVFDSHRLSAYLAMGEPERALPMLERSAADFPDDYDPPAREATAYLAMKRWDDALAAAKRARARAYGPRRLRVAALEADALEAKGDRAGAALSLREALKEVEAGPLPGTYDKLVARLRERAATLSR
jgi:tetratricopeptide (TPR) repeat protein